jgi:transposase
VRWSSRVPDTSTAARAALQVADDAWQQEGARCWAGVPQAPAGERWGVVRTTHGEERARATLQRQVEQARQTWEQQLWHLSTQRFACAPAAQAALAQQLKKCPAWLTVHCRLIAHPKQNRPGRPRTGATPDRAEWQVEASVAVEAEAVTRAVQQKASFLVATNVLDAAQLADQDLMQTYKEQHSVERGFSFLDGSPVSGLLRLHQKAKPDRRAQPHHGAVPVGVPAR